MFYSIDYYSYTIPAEKPFVEGMFYEQHDFVTHAFASSFNDNVLQQLLSADWTHESASRFYQHRLRHNCTDVTLSYGKTNPHIFVELAGKACSNFESRDILLPLIARTSTRCSRIDFAVDIKCETTPFEFITQRHNKSFKSSGSKYSPTGGTEYIGGRTSERMARVYRYYEPHPRHTLLRVEAEYKGDAAKAGAKHLSTFGVQQACLDAHKPFGWIHPEYRPDASTQARITYRNYNPEDASTVRWLYGDVITALRKAVKHNLIDFEEWLNFLRQDPKDKN